MSDMCKSTVVMKSGGVPEIDLNQIVVISLLMATRFPVVVGALKNVNLILHDLINPDDG